MNAHTVTYKYCIQNCLSVFRFHNMTYDIILFTDSITNLWRVRSLGVHRLATELRNQGYTVKVIDWCCTIFRDYALANKLLNRLIGPNTLFIGFSSNHFYQVDINQNNFQKNDAHFEKGGKSPSAYPAGQMTFEVIVSGIKKQHPHIKIVFGGKYANELVPLSRKIDYIICGYGDSTIIELADHLRKGTPLKCMPTKQPGQKILVHDKLGQSFDFPNSYTVYQPEDHIRQGEVLMLETSRGCMFKCKFCDFELLGRKTTDPKYHREIEILSQELRDNWEKYRINRYMIVDDTFNESTHKLQAVQQAIELSGVEDFKFYAYLRLDLIKKHPEQIALLRSMGLQGAFFGIETLNDASLKIIGKPMPSAEIKRFTSELAQHWPDITMHGSFIFGLPEDTPETVANWMQWVTDADCPLTGITLQALGISHVNPNVFGDDPAKYGYEVDRSQCKYPWSQSFWSNKHWNRTECLQLKRKYASEMYYSRRSRTGAWDTLGFQNMGYQFDQVFKVPYLDMDRMQMEQRVEQQYENYIQELCAYEGVEI